MDSNLAERLSSLVQYQLPDFVRDNYPEFQAFLVAYYEFLEQSGEAQYAIQNAENYKDIDDTIDSFVEYFISQYAYNLPTTIFINQETKDPLSPLFSEEDVFNSRRAFAKRLFSYHGAKGTEASINLLFRLLFNKDLSIYYPKEDILRPSEGDWRVKQSIQVFNTVGNVIDTTNIVSGKVKGVTSGSYAIIDEAKITGNTNTQKRIYELFLEPGTLVGNFQNDSHVTIEVTNPTTGNVEPLATANGVSVISSIVINNPGYGYVGNETLSVTGNGTDFLAKVSKVATGGKITDFDYINPGSNYTTVSSVSLTAPSLIKTAKYSVRGNIATVVTIDGTGNVINHGLTSGETINVQFTSGMTGANGIATIGSVISSSKFTLSNSTVFYTSTGNLQILPSAANITCVPGILRTYDAGYLNTKGHLSNDKKLIDSDYYQDYSYVLRTTEASYLWKDIIKKVIHPAGMKLFSEINISITDDVITPISVTRNDDLYDTFIYFLKQLVTEVPPIADTQAISSVFTSALTIPVSRTTGNRYRIGPTYKTLERFKFDYYNLHIYELANVAINFFADPNNLVLPQNFAPPSEANVINTTSGTFVLS